MLSLITVYLSCFIFLLFVVPAAVCTFSGDFRRTVTYAQILGL